MSNVVPFEEVEYEIGPLAQDLKLLFKASLIEDQTGVVPAKSIVSPSEKCSVKVEWKLEGEFRRHLCGKWQVKIDLESIGEAPEYSSECVEIDMNPCMDEEEWYEHTFPLDVKKLAPQKGGTVYLVDTTLSSLDPCGKIGHIWGFCKGPSVMFVPSL
jgi:hypothetical protein